MATLVGTGGQVTVMEGVSKAVGYAEKQAAKAQQAGESAAMIEILNKLAAADKLLQRDPASFEAFVATAAEDGPVQSVFIDGKTLMQSGMAPRLAELSPSVVAQLDRAILTGSDIAIPVAEYAARVAPTDLAPQLLDHLKTDPEGFSRAEAQQYMQDAASELQAEVEKTLTAAQGDAEFNASRDRVKQQVLDNLNTVGRFPGQHNELYATLIAARSAVRAAQMGVTPEAFFADRMLRVQAEAVWGQKFDQAEIQVDDLTRPTTDASGKTLHYTEEGVQNFWRWFDGVGQKQVVGEGESGDHRRGTTRPADSDPGRFALDSTGRPRPYFHGTRDSFDSFDLDHANRKDTGWLGRGVYLTSSTDLAATYANIKRGSGAPATMPVYVAVHNPLVVTLEQKRKLSRLTQAQIDEWTAKVKEAGHDGVALTFGDGAVELVAFEPEQVKSAVGNRGTFDPDDPNILHQSAKQFIHDQTQTEAFKRWSNNAPVVHEDEAATYPFKSGERVTLIGFHGTKRPDRVGTKFLKKRATSGPMSFFTSAPELASSYAMGKSDTSLSGEDKAYETWFKYKPKGARSKVDIVRAWYHLDAETKAKIAEMAPKLHLDENAEHVVVDENNTSGNGSYDYNLQQTQRGYDRRGNPLKALVEDWLNSGVLFNNEELFMEVLDKAGFPKGEAEYDSPHAEYPFVYKTYIAMNKPLVSYDVPADVVDALKEAAKKDRSRAQAMGADHWDKNTRTLREWVKMFTDDMANGDNSYVWTSIPDKVTAVFKSMGYDGIIDRSGKGGGAEHPVYIPFDEHQVKSAIGNKGKFDIHKNDILMQPDGSGARGSFSPSQNLITLLQNADPSTFLHESAHYFFEDDIALASQLVNEARSFGYDSLKPGEKQSIARPRGRARIETKNSRPHCLIASGIARPRGRARIETARPGWRPRGTRWHRPTARSGAD